MNRRDFLQATGLGGIALADLLRQGGRLGAAEEPHHAPKAKRVIFLFQAGGPSQLETFDPKPLLTRMRGQPLPDSVRQGQRLTGMSGNQATLPLADSIFPFRRRGNAGTWMSDLLPHTATIADDITVVRSMHTEAINHDPAFSYVQTGSQLTGRPSMGAWVSYGLGTENANLPSFVVLITRNKADQPLFARLWGADPLPTRHQGVQFRAGREAVLYLNNPAGVDAEGRRLMLDRLRELEELRVAETGDAELRARVAQYEMAFRMQTSVPEATDLSNEPAHVLDSYGPDARTPGTFAYHCVLARRLAERGVRFIQLYHQGWDAHGGLPGGMRRQCGETDRPSAALVKDLKRRGLLDDTLVIWGGEFGRTNYSQGRLTATDYGRDHHPRCFSYWLAGGGVRPGFTYGATCPFGYNIVEGPVHVRDFQATVLHLLGLDHERLSIRQQGLELRLTGVEPARVVREILA
jgi:Protein of unknown function (DUF1501)